VKTLSSSLIIFINFASMSVPTKHPDLLRSHRRSVFRGVRLEMLPLGVGQVAVGAVEESYREIEFGITIILNTLIELKQSLELSDILPF